MRCDIAESLERLDMIARLGYDWNGYGAEPIPCSVIDETRKLISCLSRQPEIFPTGCSSIQLEYDLPDDIYLEFDIYEGKIEAMQIHGRDYDNALYREFSYDDMDRIEQMLQEAISVSECK